MARARTAASAERAARAAPPSRRSLGGAILNAIVRRIVLGSFCAASIVASFASFASFASCAAFDESMRITKTDAATNADGSSGASSSGASSSGASSGGSCVITVPAGTGGGQCGGAGGGTFDGANEEEPNDVTPNAMDAESPRCGAVTGADIDKIAFTLQAGQCATLEVQGSASAVVEGAGVTQSIEGSGSVRFDPAKTSGQVVVTLRAPAGTAAASYKIAFH